MQRAAWSNEEMERIKRDYWRNKVAHCPNDDARLAIEPDMTTSQARILLAVCPRCGRKATDLENYESQAK